ncbi:MAG: hypothetical protein SO014_07265, partial [Candidatus Limivicinus sp.]|nr:hypothetical protein [Candidatus Limivicinus sp.]
VCSSDSKGCTKRFKKQIHKNRRGFSHVCFAMQKHSKQQDAPFSRPFGASENDAQKLHALRLLPMTVVRNPAHEVLCSFITHPSVRRAANSRFVSFSVLG